MPPKHPVGFYFPIHAKHRIFFFLANALSMKVYIMSKRGTFEMFKTEAIAVSGNESCLVSRNRNKKNSADH